MIPSPMRLTMCPPASSNGGSTTRATYRSKVRIASSPACNAHLEKPTRSVKTSVTSSGCAALGTRPCTPATPAAHSGSPRATLRHGRPATGPRLTPRPRNRRIPSSTIGRRNTDHLETLAGHDEGRRSPRGCDWCPSATPRVRWTAVARGPVDGPVTRQLPPGRASDATPDEIAAQPPRRGPLAAVRTMTPAATNQQQALQRPSQRALQRPSQRALRRPWQRALRRPSASRSRCA